MKELNEYKPFVEAQNRYFQGLKGNEVKNNPIDAEFEEKNEVKPSDTDVDSGGNPEPKDNPTEETVHTVEKEEQAVETKEGIPVLGKSEEEILENIMEIESHGVETVEIGSTSGDSEEVIQEREQNLRAFIGNVTPMEGLPANIVKYVEDEMESSLKGQKSYDNMEKGDRYFFIGLIQALKYLVSSTSYKHDFEKMPLMIYNLSKGRMEIYVDIGENGIKG